MRLARLRRFAVMLVLALLTGLAMPALASTQARLAPAGADAAPTHVHADGTVHSHAKPAQAAGQAAYSTSAKVPLHCPCCLTAAECALSCMGSAVLPTSIQLFAGSTLRSWTVAPDWPSLAFVPAGDLDPPRPVSVR